MNKISIYFILIALLSCENKNDMCGKNKATYEQQWNYTIKEKHYNFPGRRDYILEMTNGDLIGFFPVQPAFIQARPGDKFIKNKNENWTYIVSPNGDTTIARVYSDKCDSLISPKNKLER